MYTSTHIRRYIFRLQLDAIFSTRELLSFGKRAAVDKCLSRLVKRGEIIRLTRGLFKRWDGNVLPSAFIVAKHKSQAFGKQIAIIAAEATQSFKAEQSFAIMGHSTKFRFGKNIIRLQGISARKMHLVDSSAGMAIMSLWHLGKINCNKQAIMTATISFTRQDRLEMRQSIHLMPAWLADKLFSF